MNAAYLHLALNNFPPVVNLVAVAILFVGVIRHSVPLTRAGLVLLLCSLVLVVPVYYSGEGAEEIVEDMQGINKIAIHPHEEAGEAAFIVLIVQGVAALAALIMINRRWLTIVALVISLVATTAVLRTAFLGGKIHHPETEMKALGVRP